MRSFKEYTTITEAGRSRGEAMEHSIVGAVNGAEQEQTGIKLGSGKKVVTTLKLSGLGKVLGADKITISSQWSKYWPGGKVPASTKTPKTDIKIGKKKISLKTGKAAQLMSGGRNEATATFFAAIQNAKIEMTPVLSSIEEAIHNLSPASLADSSLKQEIKKGKDDVVMRANAAHKKLQTELRTVFTSNKEFAYQFAYEAMVGQVKFGGNDGTCSHFLTCTFDGDDAHLIPVSDRSYISKIADRISVTVRFKSSSQKKAGKKTGKYHYWSVVGMVVDKLNEEIDHAKTDDDSTVLTEGIVRGIIGRVKNFVANLWASVKKWLAKSTENILEFLSFEPSISFNNNIRFTP
jgi:hypothetical protein